ncbi:hypothetical protein ATANTOWER_015515 [Ataeniobius toweri]|uniref:Uncharacterized protein n=1 Tax=Ataeniobius toweri TaxID=208326 RepID=A0ABU7A0S6_9TELE|nr:hypothetical protein [Ataeniobius toweri]
MYRCLPSLLEFGELGCLFGSAWSWISGRAFCLLVLPSPSLDTSLYPFHHTTTHVGPWGAGASLECLKGFPSPRSHGRLGLNFNVQLRHIFMTLTCRALGVGMLNGIRSGVGTSPLVLVAPSEG